MDANGTRFHLLLGELDWRRCHVERGSIDWDPPHAELTLSVRGEKFVASPADTPPRVEDRRGVSADRFGNVYWIDATGTRVLVLSSGSGRVSEFWPGEPDPSLRGHGDFTDDGTTPSAARRLAGVAVTEDHYLAVGVIEPAGLLAFDLVAGGSPIEIRWPAMGAAAPFEPVDLAPRPGCGVLILDRARRYWSLDAGFGVVTANQGQVAISTREVAEFQPVDGGPARETAAVAFPAGTVLDATSPLELANPIAIEATAGGEVLILDAGAAAANSRVVCYRDGRGIGVANLDFHAHDFALVAGRLFIASSGGNQAFAYDVEIGDGLRLAASPEFLPMRRFAGRGLVVVPELLGKPQVFYDFGESWVPLVHQRRVRYEESAEIVTPVLDSAELDCVWHRLMLDACIPPGASVEAWSRAADETDGESIGAAWRKEPVPYLRGGGSELPWSGRWPGRRAKEAHATDRDGTWELLFQHARGRYLQVKLVLQSDGRCTPRLRALRAWYPRFSFVEHYLPAVYREDAGSASFFERFLANFEGTWTAIEDRVASVQAVFDVRSVPADALDWLADWFGVAIDPAWDERRQRLFIRHAMDFFQYRGTLHGLRMALHLAFDECIDEGDLGPPETARPGWGDIRIVESYRLRGAPPVVFGQPEELEGPRMASSGGVWSPAEGNAGLVRRYREFTGDAAPPAPEEEAIPFALAPREDTGGEAGWEKRRAFLRRALGIVPATGAEARTRWQDFLAQRYRRVESLNTRHGTHWPSFASIPLPDELPADGAPLDDWLQFELRAEPMHAFAHRFRVLLPTPAGGTQPALARQQMELAQRIVDLEKPAHTAFDVRFFWSLFRIGDARLGFDTLMDQGSRAPQLLPDTVLGRSFTGTSFVAGGETKREAGRMALAC